MTAQPTASRWRSSSQRPGCTLLASRKHGRRNPRSGWAEGLSRPSQRRTRGGSGGVEPWVSCGLHVSPDSTFVLHASPQLLVAMLVWQSPDVADGPDAAPERRAHAAVTIRQRRPAGCPLFLLANANAKLGSVTSPFVGGHQADPQSPTGEFLRELLAEQDLAVAATVASRGESWTRQSNSGRRHQIDLPAGLAPRSGFRGGPPADLVGPG